MFVCARPPEPYGSAIGLGLRTQRKHVVLRPDGPGRALRARCGRTSPSAVALERWSAILAVPAVALSLRLGGQVASQGGLGAARTTASPALVRARIAPLAL